MWLTGLCYKGLSFPIQQNTMLSLDNHNNYIKGLSFLSVMNMYEKKAKQFKFKGEWEFQIILDIRL